MLPWGVAEQPRPDAEQQGRSPTILLLGGAHQPSFSCHSEAFSLWSRPNGRGVTLGATVQISHRGNPGSTVSPGTAFECSADGHPSLKLTGVKRLCRKPASRWSAYTVLAWARPRPTTPRSRPWASYPRPPRP